MQYLHLLEWTGVALGILGAVLNARGLRLSFAVWLASSLLLVTFASLHHHWGLLLLFGTYTVINIFGLFNWKGNAPTRIRK